MVGADILADRDEVALLTIFIELVQITIGRNSLLKLSSILIEAMIIVMQHLKKHLQMIVFE